MGTLQTLTRDYALALCDAPSDVDSEGWPRHRECACPRQLTDWLQTARDWK